MEDSRIISIKPMTREKAFLLGYEMHGIGSDGYEIIYPDGGKRWCQRNLIDDVFQWNACNLMYEYAPHIQRMINEYEQLAERIDKLNAFINGNTIFKKLGIEERNDMVSQLHYMRNYSDVLLSRLTRAGVDFRELI